MGKDRASKNKQQQAPGYKDPESSRLADALAVWGALGSTFLVSRSSEECKSEGPTDGGIGMTQAVGVLARWGRLCSDLQSSQSGADWQPAQLMVDAMQAWGEVQKGNYRDVLDKSAACLAPFGEPLQEDFGAHGWLKKDREESYTAWLRWIVEKLRHPDLVFRLFGIIDDPVPLQALSENFRRPECEVCILENTRRLDLVIRYEDAVLIVVEVKVTGADSADTAKQEDYFDWMNREPEPFRRAILVANDATEEEYKKFRFVSWAHVCVELRRIAPRYFSSRPIVAAMILAFVSAVERNLLGLSLPDPSAPAITWMAHSAVFEHIKASLSGELQ